MRFICTMLSSESRWGWGKRLQNTEKLEKRLQNLHDALFDLQLVNMERGWSKLVASTEWAMVRPVMYKVCTRSDEQT
jgi:hypothetical protein